MLISGFHQASSVCKILIRRLRIHVSFFFLHGMGLVNQFSENLIFDTISIAPNKESGRTSAAWADGIQCSGCRGKLVVKNCIFSGTHDDAINIHGTHLRVVERVSEDQIKVTFAGPNQVPEY